MSSKAEVKIMISPDPKVALDFLINLMSNAKDAERENSFIVVKSNLETLNHNQQVGVISYDEYSTKVSQITANILYLVDSLPDTYFNSGDSKQVLSPDDDANYATKRAMASKLIKELSDFEIQYATLSYQNLNQNNDYDVDTLFNSKREALVYQIIWFIESNNLSISSADYVVIAMSLVSVYDDTRAEQYYKKAISNIDAFTESAISKISAKRSYASFLYLKGRLDDGAKQYDGAILQGDDDTTLSINGYTLQLKYGSESYFMNKDNADKAYQDAMGYYSKIKNEVYKQNCINSLQGGAKTDTGKVATTKKTGIK